ncbi:MAG: fused MFS/spermidine synthase, partial [Candidatus Omnitrophica bacterium]|nr:fused MFS/spermidine synthase [Candidatus Omnitrophota bacterium]
VKVNILLATITFCAGAITMVIELAGNRLLAPLFGNTLYTWTGLIGIILAAMSAGYYFGGWLADKKPSFIILGNLLLASSLFAFIAPLLYRVTEPLLIGTSIIWGPALASLIFFAMPAFFLGTVTPFAIRLASAASGDRHVGIAAGFIGMLSVLGSVTGTFATGFFLIPLLGIRAIFTLSGILLAILALILYLFSSGKKKTKIIHVSVVALILASSYVAHAAGAIPREPYILYQHTNFYHRITVIKQWFWDAGGARMLHLDTTTEGGQFENSMEPVLAYYRYWQLAQLRNTAPARILVLGGGSFYLPELFTLQYPQSNVEVFEIDPEVVRVGKTFFRTDQYPTMNIQVGDARRQLAMSTNHYDVIFGDAYHGKRNIPAHLVTKEFFASVNEHLTDDGIYIMNIISALQGEKSRLLCSIVKTLSRVFAGVYVFSVEPGFPDQYQNVLIVATKKSLDIETKKSKAQGTLRAILETYIAPHVYASHMDTASIFTDDYNPVEYIIAQGLTS